MHELGCTGITPAPYPFWMWVKLPSFQSYTNHCVEGHLQDPHLGHLGFLSHDATGQTVAPDMALP